MVVVFQCLRRREVVRNGSEANGHVTVYETRCSCTFVISGTST